MKRLDRVVFVMVVGAFAALGTGCAGETEFGARYDLEKRMYEARRLEREEYAQLPADDFAAWRTAVQAYSDVLNSNHARIPESVAWNQNVVRDMDRVALDAQIGIVRLGFFDHRYHAAVTHEQFVVPPLASPLDATRRVETPLTSALYDSTSGELRGGGLARRVRDVVENPLLWIDTDQLRDSLLVIPLGMVSRGKGMPLQAEAFYTRIIETWPDSAAAASALVCRAGVRAFARDYEAALSDIDSAIAGRDTQWRVELLLLRKAELLALGLGRPGQSIPILRDIVAREPDSDDAWAARLRLAMWEPSPITSLRELHLGERTPPEVAAAAMFERARLLREAGEREEALALFWRLTQRYPYTPQAMASPLLVLNDLRENGPAQEIEGAVRHARDYYLDVIGRDTASLEPRHLAKDFLIEAYLATGAPRAAAELLLERSAVWGGDNAVVARYKSALIHRYLLRDEEKAVEILQKTLVQYPGSRYARSVRRELERVWEAREG